MYIVGEDQVVSVYGGVDVQIHIFLTSALAGGEWSASRTGRYNPGERAPLLDRILGEPQTQCGRCGGEKILDPTRTRTLTPQSSSP
jgi:hypothetical protein